MQTKICTKIPKVVYKDLTKQKIFKNPVWGYADKTTSNIILERNIAQRTWIEIFIHEHLHCFIPDASEVVITKLAGILADGIWNRGYRKTRKRK